MGYVIAENCLFWSADPILPLFSIIFLVCFFFTMFLILVIYHNKDVIFFMRTLEGKHCAMLPFFNVLICLRKYNIF